MNKTDTWVINYFNKCFNLNRSCLVLLRIWTRQILGSSTTLTMFQSEKKLSGSTQKMNRTDTWVINYFNKCFNLKRSCLVLLRRWTRQLPESSTILTNVSIWKEVVWFYSEDEQDRYLGQQLLYKCFTWVINYFNKCFNLKISCLVLLRRWTRQIPESSTTSTNVSIWKEVA